MLKHDQSNSLFINNMLWNSAVISNCKMGSTQPGFLIGFRELECMALFHCKALADFAH